jgi:hypothetical protein
MQCAKRKKNYWLSLFFSCSLSLIAHAQIMPGQIIVQLEEGQDIDQLRLLPGLTHQKTLSRRANIHLWRFDTLKLKSDAAIHLALRHSPVLLAQVNHQLQVRDTLPSDPLFPQQWQWHNISAQNSLPDADVDANLAWALPAHGAVTANGDTIVVAIVDDGVQANHPDLSANLWRNHHEIPNNQIDDDQNGYVDDYRGWNATLGSDHIHQGHHGTMVAGMISAAWNNETGGTGIAPHIKMMVVAGGSQTEAEALAAYDYVLTQRLRYNETQGEQGAFIVATNTSWGVNGLDPAEAPVWCQFYDLLGEAGILNCAATANANWNIDEVGDMPTACSSPYLITATASNRMDECTGAYGPVSVDLAAPGQEVLTTQPGGGYGWSSGTSFASPIVAGTVALLYSAACPDLATLALTDPAAAALEAKTMILNTVDPIPGMVGQTVSEGRLNTHLTLQELAQNCNPCPPVNGLSAIATDDRQIVVTWAGINPSLPVTVVWRPVGSTEWQTLPLATSPLILDQLLPCTPYEVQALYQCPDSLMTTSPLITVLTDGCCLPPSNITTSSITPSEAILSWDAPGDAASFSIQLQNETGWIFNTTQNGNSIHLSGLSPCTVYEAYVATLCQGGSSDTTTFRFVTQGCGSCTGLEYCPSYGGTSGTEWIDALSFGPYHHFSGLNEGTPLFPAQGFTAVSGQTVNISVRPGFQHVAFPEYIRIWMDINQDGQFDVNTECLLDTLLLPGHDSLHAALSIPENAIPGTTRMRVSLKWAGFGSMRPTPCEPTIHFGEVEDYCVDILAPSILNPTNEAKETNGALQVWPNPFGTQLQLRYTGIEGSAKVQLLGLDGRLHLEQHLKLQAGQTISLSPSPQLPSGCYILQVQVRDQIFQRRLIH